MSSEWKSFWNILFKHFSSLAAEMLPLPSAEPDPAKSLLHEKLYEKNAAMSKGFSSWVDEHYNLVKDKNIFLDIHWLLLL